MSEEKSPVVELLPGINTIDALSEEEMKHLDETVKKIDLDRGGVSINPGLFDLLALASFGSESRYKIVLSVIRMTLVSHTTEAVITGRDLESRTGLNSGQVAKSLQSLLQANIIICTNPIQTRDRSYKFNKYWRTWKPIQRAKWNESEKIKKVRRQLKIMQDGAEKVKINRHLKKLLALEFHNGDIINSEVIMDTEENINREDILHREESAYKAETSANERVLILDYIFRFSKSQKNQEREIIKRILYIIIKELYYRRRDYTIDSDIEAVIDDVLTVFASIPGIDCYRSIFDPDRDIDFWSDLCRNPRYKIVDKVSLLKSIDLWVKERPSKKANIRLMTRNWCETSLKQGRNLKNVFADGAGQGAGAGAGHRGKYTLSKKS